MVEVAIHLDIDTLQDPVQKFRSIVRNLEEAGVVVFKSRAIPILVTGEVDLKVVDRLRNIEGVEKVVVHQECECQK